MRGLCALVLAFGIALSGEAYAQDDTGIPVDADTFRTQSQQSTGQSATEQELHQLLQQTLGNPNAPPPVQEQPADQSGPEAVWLMGMGQTSCSDWLNPTRAGLADRGSEWVSGYWTGMNTLNGANHNVGKDAGIKTAIDDMKKRCADHPDETLYVAASEVYVAYMKGGK